MTFFVTTSPPTNERTKLSRVITIVSLVDLSYAKLVIFVLCSESFVCRPIQQKVIALFLHGLFKKVLHDVSRVALYPSCNLGTPVSSQPGFFIKKIPRLIKYI